MMGLDGKDHINIYSGGKTSLGRKLSTYFFFPIEIPNEGRFNTIEGYWHWLETSDDSLKEMMGFPANMYASTLKKKPLSKKIFKEKLKNAFKIKIETFPSLRKEFLENKLPFQMYYQKNDELIIPKESELILKLVEELKKEMGS